MTPAPPQLKTRTPTGQVAYPLLLVEGGEKVGKTYAALSLSASDRVGRTFVLELDEPTADEYAPLGDFEILEHNGTYSSILGQLEAAAAVPMEDGKPNVIILDTGTALWKLLSRWAEHRARTSKRGQKQLAEDPDAEVDVAMNLWNDATDRWYNVIYLLRNWAGIGVMVARSKETAKVVNGNPVAGQTEYKIEAQKSTANEVSAVVRMENGHVARLMAVRSLHVDVPPRGLVLDPSNPLEHLVFNVLGAGGHFQVSSAVSASLGMSVAAAKTKLIEILKRAVPDEAAAKTEAVAVWEKAALGEIVEVNEQQFATIASLAAERITEITQGPTPPPSVGDVPLPVDANGAAAEPTQGGPPDDAHEPTQGTL